MIDQTKSDEKKNGNTTFICYDFVSINICIQMNE